MIDMLKDKTKLYLYGDESNSWWRFLEGKTGYKREHIALGALSFLVIYLAFGWYNDFFCNFIGFLYPAYVSVLAIEFPTTYDNAKWLIYWIIYVVLGLVEYWRHIVTYSVPFYWLIKCIFLLWLMMSKRTDDILLKIICLLRLQGWLSEYKKSGLIINPPNENVELHVRNVNNIKNVIRLKSNPQGVIKLNFLEDGNYEIEAYSLGMETLLLLHKFQITIVNKTSNVPAVDLQATTLNATFIRNDKPFDGARVKGKFTDKYGHSYNLNGQTSSNGVISIALPEGIIENFAATKDDIIVKKIGNVMMLPPVPTPVNVPRPPKEVNISMDSSSFSFVVNLAANVRVVVLGDISGSMGSGTKMDILKRSFQEIFEKCQNKGCNVSLASWDTEVEWCTENWIQRNESSAVKQWIQNRRPRGGNDMRNAIEECMKRYPNVTDVYVMCDGDITPFELQKGEGDWATCRSRFMQTKFHFIGLGLGASFEPMEAMAAIGDGTFTQNT